MWHTSCSARTALHTTQTVRHGMQLVHAHTTLCALYVSAGLNYPICTQPLWMLLPGSCLCSDSGLSHSVLGRHCWHTQLLWWLAYKQAA